MSEARKILGEEGLLTDIESLRIYGQDWSGLLEPRPCAVALPRTTEEVAEILKLCTRAHVAVVPSGGRTGLSGGAIASSGELVLSLNRMNRMDPVDLASRTVRVQAGAITQTVHDHCVAYGLTWPVDFASKGSSQVGGNISTNAGGVRVIRYGSTRQWVLSIQLVTAAGEILELNGDLEKNNTGYDIRQLVVGAEGTLGVVTEATLRLAPVPVATTVAFFAVADLTAVARLFASTRALPVTLSAFEYLGATSYRSALSFLGKERGPVSPECGAYVLIEIEESAPMASVLELERLLEIDGVIDAVIAQNLRESSQLWLIRECVAESVLAVEGKKRIVHQHDVAVPIRHLPEFAARIEARYRSDYPDFEVFIFGHIGDGNLHIFVRMPDGMKESDFLRRCHDSDQLLFEFVREYGGSVSAEHGIGLLKRNALPFSRSEVEMRLMRGLRKVFDPQGILNPGKLI